jgi:zinc D-Ala-D-Ala carboxypeptidase
MTAINFEMKIFKSSTILIVILLILMVAYYLILQNYKANDTNNIPTAVHNDTLTHKKQLNNKMSIDTIVSVDFLTGKFNPAKDTSFTLVDLEYGVRSDMYLLKETYKAFIKMFYAAQHDGVKLFIISAARNFVYQKSIWEQKWSGNKLVEGKNLATSVKDPVKRAEIILKYSSMPATSRHHWGTDVDLNSMEDKYFSTVEGKKVYDWLCVNASKYGFCHPFNAKNIRTNGYEEEKWHWSYMPLSRIFLNQYKNKVTYANITGFSGCETAAKLEVIKNYVLSINSECK